MNTQTGSANGDIKALIGLLKETNIDGCITGSSMLYEEVDFDMWDNIPDVDCFVYSESMLVYAVTLFMEAFGYSPASKGEAWKINKLMTRGTKKNMPVSTVKLAMPKSDIVVNFSYKPTRINVIDILSSFDMSIIMRGHDIRKGITIDLRCGWEGMIPEDSKEMWSNSTRVAVPNPLREQKVDMYGTEKWVRQFERVIKYWDRGFDTRPMAKFYIKLIDQVISDGLLFQNEAGEQMMAEFMETYLPIKQKMENWLESKEGIDDIVQ